MIASLSRLRMPNSGAMQQCIAFYAARIDMRAVTTPALKVVALHQSAHCRLTHRNTLLLTYPIAELLECTVWITCNERSQVISVDLLLQRKRLLGKILAYFKENL